MRDKGYSAVNHGKVDLSFWLMHDTQKTIGVGDIKVTHAVVPRLSCNAAV